MRPTEISQSLKIAWSANIATMMWGTPGIGKSDVVRNTAREEGREVRDIRLALLDPTDLRGIPYYNLDTKTAEWAVAKMLPQDPNSNDVIFLDEINAAPPAVQAAAYQLVLDRAIGEYRLPENVRITAAGNNDTDKAVTYKMPTPLLNRFTHLEYEVHFEDWYDWAIQNNIHEHVISFLNHQKSKINQFDPKSASKGFPTPRSWAVTSKILYNQPSEKIARGMIAGTIGDGAMSEFMTYRKVYKNLPDPMDVLTGRVTKLPDRDDVSIKYAMMTSLVYTMRDEYTKVTDKKTDFKDFDKLCDGFFSFIHDSDNFSPEFAIMGVRDAMKNLKIPIAKTTAWKPFAADYGRLITGVAK